MIVERTWPDRLVQRVNGPENEPISLSEAKTYLRVDGSTEDALIGEMVQAVRIAAEEATGRSLMTQRWRVSFGEHLPDRVALPYGPVQAVVSVKSVDEAGDSTTLATTAYVLDVVAGELVCKSAIVGHRVEVEYDAGYGDAATDVPVLLKHGMLLHLLRLYGSRDGIEPPKEALAAYAPYRELRI